MQPTSPNRFRAGVTTYLRTSFGWWFLAVWIDLFSPRVVGWALDQWDGYRPGDRGPQRALGHRQVESEQHLVHTKQGSQSKANDYRERLHKEKITGCMSVMGRGWDNAVLVSFFSTQYLKAYAKQ